MLKPIFVCSGNICRSPMAEAIAKHIARERGERIVTVSMGTLNITGRSASAEAIEACREIGVDLSGHVSQGVKPSILRVATHVLVMEDHHRESLLAMDPGLAHRIRLLGELDDHPDDQIPDPVGQPLEVFRVCRARIVDSLEGLFATTG